VNKSRVGDWKLERLWNTAAVSTRDVGRRRSGAWRLGLRPEKPPSGACLTLAAPVRVIRTPVRDRLDNEVMSDAWDESRTSADEDACRRFFRTDAAACPHRAAPLTCRGRRACGCRGSNTRVDGQHRRLALHADRERFEGEDGGEGLSGRRRDADSPLLARHDHAGEVENRAAGVPIRVRGVSPLTEWPTALPTLISTKWPASPSERGIVRHAPEAWFSGRRPRRRGADRPSPLRRPAHLTTVAVDSDTCT
jgi:hypothetical protein